MYLKKRKEKNIVGKVLYQKIEKSEKELSVDLGAILESIVLKS